MLFLLICSSVCFAMEASDEKRLATPPRSVVSRESSRSCGISPAVSPPITPSHRKVMSEILSMPPGVVPVCARKVNHETTEEIQLVAAEVLRLTEDRLRAWEEKQTAFSSVPIAAELRR